MAVTSAVTDLFASAYELVASLLNAAWTIVHSFIMGIAGLFTGVFTFFADIFKGLFDVVGGVGKFVTGTFFPPFAYYLRWR
jgi:phage-related protein